MKPNYHVVIALGFGALTNGAANKPLITSSSILPPPPPLPPIVTIPCNTTTSAETTICHECPKSTAPPFANTTSQATPPVTPPATVPGTLTVPCIKCPESTTPPGVAPITITTTAFVTVPCSTEVVSVPSQPVIPPNTVPPIIIPPLNAAPTNVVPSQNTGPPVPAFPSSPLVSSKAVPTPGGEVPGASNTAVPSPPSSSFPIAPAPPAASSRPGVPAGPPSPAPSPTGPPRPPAFTGAGSVLDVNPRGTLMAIIVAALAML